MVSTAVLKHIFETSLLQPWSSPFIVIMFWQFTVLFFFFNLCSGQRGKSYMAFLHRLHQTTSFLHHPSQLTLFFRAPCVWCNKCDMTPCHLIISWCNYCRLAPAAWLLLWCWDKNSAAVLCTVCVCISTCACHMFVWPLKFVRILSATFSLSPKITSPC